MKVILKIFTICMIIYAVFAGSSHIIAAHTLYGNDSEKEMLSSILIGLYILIVFLGVNTLTNTFSKASLSDGIVNPTPANEKDEKDEKDVVSSSNGLKGVKL